MEIKKNNKNENRFFSTGPKKVQSFLRFLWKKSKKFKRKTKQKKEKSGKLKKIQKKINVESKGKSSMKFFCGMLIR